MNVSSSMISTSGRNLGGQLASRLLDQGPHRCDVHLQDFGGVVLGKALERDQQEAWRGFGVRLASRASAGMSSVTWVPAAFSPTEPQILVKRR